MGFKYPYRSFDRLEGSHTMNNELHIIEINIIWSLPTVHMSCYSEQRDTYIKSNMLYYKEHDLKNTRFA
jgi:hypothetical protein